MQLIKLLIFFLLPTFLCAQKVKIKFPVTFKQPYCGGARPNEDQIHALEQPRALRNAYFVVLHANGKADSVKSNENGIISIRLAKGEYKVYEAWRYKMYTPNNMPISSFDKTCLIGEWERFAYTLTVEKRKFKLKSIYQIETYCDWTLPCWTAEILVPPSAPPGK